MYQNMSVNSMEQMTVPINLHPNSQGSTKSTRLFALDIIKCWAVLLMFVSHVLIIYGTTWLESSPFFAVVAFIVESVCAPVFVFAMGLSIALSKAKTPKQILTRSVILFVQGYVLNVLKFFFPIKVFNSFPPELFVLLEQANSHEGLFNILLMGDILQFAAIAYAIVGILRYYSKHYHYIAFVLILVCLIISPLLYDCVAPNQYYFLGLLYGRAPLMFFPLLPWIIFPLLGLLVGHCITQQMDVLRKAMIRLFVIGIVVLVFGWVLLQINPLESEMDYYHRGTAGLLLFSGMTLAWTAFAYFTTPLVPNVVKKGILFFSEHVTSIYFIQWILIYWGVGIIGFKNQNAIGYLVCLLGFMLSTSLLIKVWEYSKMKRLN